MFTCILVGGASPGAFGQQAGYILNRLPIDRWAAQGHRTTMQIFTHSEKRNYFRETNEDEYVLWEEEVVSREKTTHAWREKLNISCRKTLVRI